MGDIEQNNRLIAEYMEGVKSKLPWLELKNYHSDWNALMPVVLKIAEEANLYINFIFNEIKIEKYDGDLNPVLTYRQITSNPDPILAVWECVVQYIKNRKQ